MTRYFWYLAAMALSVILPAAAEAAELTPLNSPADNRPFIYAQSIPFGAYDPPGDFVNDKNSKVEHLFLPWLDVDLSFLDVADSYAQARGRDILITIEPWTWSENVKIAPDALYDGIMQGHYDTIIANICGKLAPYKSKVIVRWAQEMEDRSGRFIWAGWKPDSYKRAYRHFVEKCRASASNVLYMWSPKGLPNLGEYYPGNDVVDLVGLSVFGYQPYDRGEFGHDRNFEEILKPGYTAAVKFGKPIWVAELGYSGNKDYVAAWQQETMKPHPDFPELKTSVYFNDKEVWPWPKDYGMPNWIVRENIINYVVGSAKP